MFVFCGLLGCREWLEQRNGKLVGGFGQNKFGTWYQKLQKFSIL